MKFNREQQRELKKIDAAFDVLMNFSKKGEMQTDAVLMKFTAPDMYEQKKQVLHQRNRSRQEVFEMSQKKSEKAVVKNR